MIDVDKFKTNAEKYINYRRLDPKHDFLNNFLDEVTTLYPSAQRKAVTAEVDKALHFLMAAMLIDPSLDIFQRLEERLEDLLFREGLNG